MWAEKNREKIKEVKIKWEKRNPEKVKKYSKAYRESPKNRISIAIKVGIYESLKRNKKDTWRNIVNFNITSLKKRLKSKMTKGMSFENYGKWHIDHVIPKA